MIFWQKVTIAAVKFQKKESSNSHITPALKKRKSKNSTKMMRFQRMRENEYLPKWI